MLGIKASEVEKGITWVVHFFTQARAPRQSKNVERAFCKIKFLAYKKFALPPLLFKPSLRLASLKVGSV